MKNTLRNFVLVSILLESTTGLAGDLGLNEACISIANSFNLIDPSITLAAIGSEVVALKLEGKAITMIRSDKEFSIDGGSCRTVGTTSEKVAEHLQSGLANYIHSGKAKKEVIDKVRAVCSKAPFFKATLDETLKFNRELLEKIDAAR